ncbi:MAG: tyrosine-type recombinase/integrase [Gemmatimonadota bacterium]|nr:tyrosine-type recombinase/integrase [Gemmatimonadota bacterium]
MTEDAIRKKLADLRSDDTVNLSAGSRRVYGTFWRDFERWCGKNGFESLPATPTTVVGYLMHRYETGLALTTLKTVRNAIASKHRLAGLDRPTNSEDVKTCLRLLRRKAAKSANRRVKPKQAPGVRLEHIKMLEGDRPLDEELDGPWLAPPFGLKWTEADERRHAMDCAVVTVMHSALLRTAEAADLRWSDIVPLANGQARLTIRRSKTSDEPMTRLLTTRAVGWLKKIMPKNADPEDRVFRVKTGRAIHNRIVRCLSDSGIRPGATGHSPRVGGAQDLTIRGASLQQVKEAGGWRNLSMPAQYAEKVRPEVGGVNLLEDD